MSVYVPNPRPLVCHSERKFDLRRRWEIATPLHLWHLTSLDAPAVAVVWSVSFAWAADVKTPWWTPPLLAMVAWAVYIGDRLLDARAGLQNPPQHELQDRHYFHWRHRRILGACAVGAAVASGWMIIMLAPRAARVPDSAVGVATLAYFSGVHWRRRPQALQGLLTSLFSKEFLVGVLFTAGCMVPAWSQLRAHPEMASQVRTLFIPGVFFAALAWLNCFAIARWESANSRGNTRQIKTLGRLLGITGVVTALMLAPVEPRAGALVGAGAMSAFLIAGIDCMRTRISALTVRAAADLVLLTPIAVHLSRFMVR